MFDIVRKKLEDHINKRAYFIREPFTLMFSGLSGSDPEPAANVPGTIHLIFGRNTMEDPVELTIVIIYSNGVRSESPIRIFEKSPRSDGEELLEARILFDSVTLAVDWLLHPLKHNRPMRLQTGRPQCYEWRRNIAESLTPPMESEELGARIAAFCSVKTMQPIDLSNRGNKRPHPDADLVDEKRPAARAAAQARPVTQTFAEKLLLRLTEYFIAKLGGDWKDVQLIVTGLTGMNAEPPGDEIKTYVHLTYTRMLNRDVHLQVIRKSEKKPDLYRSFQRIIVRSDYEHSKTFYGQLLFAGIFGATVEPHQWPDQKKIIQFRGRIGTSLKPKVSGANLGIAMRAYQPLPPQWMRGEILLRNLSE